MLSVMAMMDSFNVVHDRVLNGSSVLVNDSIMMNPGPLTASLVSGPSQGSLTLNTNGTFVYTPPASFTGSTSFVYKATANGEWSNATVSINVTNMAPTVVNQYLSVAHGKSLTINPLAGASDADGDALQATLYGGPTLGSWVINGNGTWTYSAPANWTGSVYFNVTANDGLVESGAVSIYINVTNSTPMVMGQSLSMGHDQVLPNIDLLTNSFDADNDSLQVSLVTNPAHGVLLQNTTGTNGTYFTRNHFELQAFGLVPAAWLASRTASVGV